MRPPPLNSMSVHWARRFSIVRRLPAVKVSTVADVDSVVEEAVHQGRIKPPKECAALPLK